MIDTIKRTPGEVVKYDYEFLRKAFLICPGLREAFENKIKQDSEKEAKDGRI